MLLLLWLVLLLVMLWLVLLLLVMLWLMLLLLILLLVVLMPLSTASGTTRACSSTSIGSRRRLNRSSRDRTVWILSGD
jgi:hypothetical protein